MAKRRKCGYERTWGKGGLWAQREDVRDEKEREYWKECHKVVKIVRFVTQVKRVHIKSLN